MSGEKPLIRSAFCLCLLEIFKSHTVATRIMTGTTHIVRCSVRTNFGDFLPFRCLSDLHKITVYFSRTMTSFAGNSFLGVFSSGLIISRSMTLQACLPVFLVTGDIIRGLFHKAKGLKLYP